MMIPIQKIVFLWLLQESPVTSCDNDVKEFVLIGHIYDVTGNVPSYSFLLGRQHSRYQLLTNAAQVQHIIKILQEFQTLMQFVTQISICNFSQSLARARHLCHLLTLMRDLYESHRQKWLIRKHIQSRSSQKAT
jgi:hypothetical protein